MASRVAIDTKVSARTGTTAITFTAADVTDKNYFTNTGKEVVLINNVGVGSVTVTFSTPGIVDGSAMPDLAVVVAAGAIAVVGPFPRGLYSTTYTDEEDPPADHENVVLFEATSADAEIAVIKVGS